MVGGGARQSARHFCVGTSGGNVGRKIDGREM
jgi:hypothetical protein